MNKRGALGDQIVMFAFMFLLVLIGGGVVLGTYMFFGTGFDYRGVEASMLGAKIKSCILSDSSWLGDLKANPDLFYQKCGLNKAVIEKNNAIRVCPKQAEVAGCLDPRADAAVFSVGSYQLCDPAGSSKLVGCSVLSFGKNDGDGGSLRNYIVVATSRQIIRRNV